MKYILLAITLMASLVGGITRKHTISKLQNKNVMYYVFNFVISFVTAILLILMSGDLNASPFTWVLGIVFGVTTAIQTVYYLKAFDIGPFSYTMVIASLSTIIPALSGFLFFNETISFVQIIGMFLMVICFIFSVDFKANDKKASFKWLFYTVVVFIMQGAIGVMQKWHQNTAFKGELDAFLVIAFFASALFSIICLLFVREDKKTVIKTEATKKIVLLMVLAGLCSAPNNKINLYLSGVMESFIFFPVVNGGGLVLSMIASLVVFREKFNLQKTMGLIIGIVSVILLCNPF